MIKNDTKLNKFGISKLSDIPINTNVSLALDYNNVRYSYGKYNIQNINFKEHNNIIELQINCKRVISTNNSGALAEIKKQARYAIDYYNNIYTEQRGARLHDDARATIAIKLLINSLDNFKDVVLALEDYGYGVLVRNNNNNNNNNIYVFPLSALNNELYKESAGIIQWDTINSIDISPYIIQHNRYNARLTIDILSANTFTYHNEEENQNKQQVYLDLTDVYSSLNLPEEYYKKKTLIENVTCPENVIDEDYINYHQALARLKGEIHKIRYSAEDISCSLPLSLDIVPLKQCHNDNNKYIIFDVEHKIPAMTTTIKARQII